MTSRTIDIAVFGAVSAGKSTFVNALFAKKLSDMAKGRTTAMPQIYHGRGPTEIAQDATKIHKENKARNAQIMGKTERSDLKYADIKEHEYHIAAAPDIFELSGGVYAAIHDLPGLNDAKTKAVYMEYIRTNFHRYAIVLFLVSIDSALNTADEIEILNMIIQGIKVNAAMGVVTKCIILINKCDEMVADPKSKDGLKLTDSEFAVMEKQLINIAAGAGAKDMPFVKISSEDMFVYRVCKYAEIKQLDPGHINKLGISGIPKKTWGAMDDKRKTATIVDMMPKIKDDYDEYMTLCGFAALRETMAAMLTKPGQLRFLLNSPYHDMYHATTDGNDSKWLGSNHVFRGRIKKIVEIFGATPTPAEYAPLSRHMGREIARRVTPKMTYISEHAGVLMTMSAKSYHEHNQLVQFLREISMFTITIDPGLDILLDETRFVSAAIDAANVNIGRYHQRILENRDTTHTLFREHMKLAAEGKHIVGNFAVVMETEIMPKLASRPGWEAHGKDIIALIHEFAGICPVASIRELILLNVQAQFAGILRDIAPRQEPRTCRDIAQIRANMLELRRAARGAKLDGKNKKYMTYIAEFANIILYSNRGSHVSVGGGISCSLSVCIDSFDGPLIEPTINMDLISRFIVELRRSTV